MLQLITISSNLPVAYAQGGLAELLNGGPTGQTFNFSKGLDYVLGYAKDLTSVNNTVATNLRNTGASELFTDAISQPIGTLIETASGSLEDGTKASAWTNTAVGLVDSLGFLGKAGAAKVVKDVPIYETLDRTVEQMELPSGAPIRDLYDMVASGVDISKKIQELDVANRIQNIISSNVASDIKEQALISLSGMYPEVDVMEVFTNLQSGAVDKLRGTVDEFINTETFGAKAVNTRVGRPGEAVAVNAVAADARKLVLDALNTNGSNNPIGVAVGNFMENSEFLDVQNISLPLNQLLPGERVTLQQDGSLRNMESKISAIIAESLAGVQNGKEVFEPSIKKWQQNKYNRRQAEEAAALEAAETEVEVDAQQERVDELVSSLTASAPRRLAASSDLEGQSSFGARAVPTVPADEVVVPDLIIDGPNSQPISLIVDDEVQLISTLANLPDVNGLGIDSPEEDTIDMTTFEALLPDLQDEVSNALYIVTASAQSMMSFVDQIYVTRSSLVPFLGDHYTDVLMQRALDTVVKFLATMRESTLPGGEQLDAMFELDPKVLDIFQDVLPLLANPDATQGL